MDTFELSVYCVLVNGCSCGRARLTAGDDSYTVHSLKTVTMRAMQKKESETPLACEQKQRPPNNETDADREGRPNANPAGPSATRNSAPPLPCFCPSTSRRSGRTHRLPRSRHPKRARRLQASAQRERDTTLASECTRLLPKGK